VSRAVSVARGTVAADWRVDAEGWVPAARRVASPNFDARPADSPIELLLIHGISLPPGDYGGDAIERLFTNALDPQAHPFFALVATARVSSHFLIRRDGVLVQFVSCRVRAWHAGASTFEGRPSCNDFSVGIELEGTDFSPYEPAQYATLARLTLALRAAYPLRAVRGHDDFAPSRKTDPGPAFDWAAYARLAALPAAWLPPAPTLDPTRA